MAVIMSICFVGCNNTQTNHPNSSENDSVTTEDKYSHLLFSSASNTQGAYIIRRSAKPSAITSDGVIDYSNSSGNFLLIKFIDNASLKEVVLCGKPNCAHKDDTCNAYIPSALQVTSSNGNVRFPIMHSQGYIFFQNDKLYVIDPFGDIVMMNPDGTEHEKILSIDSKYNIQKGYLYNNKVYLHASYLSPFEADTEQEFTDKDYNLALLEIDLQKKSCKEIFSFANELETEFLGLYESKAYYFYRSPNKTLASHTQQAVDNEENSHDIKLYSYDLETGKKILIVENKKSHEMDNVILSENAIYYHNRKGKELQQLCLDTDKTETIVAEFGGYIKFFYTQTFYDNRLFFVRDNALADAFSAKPKANETCYLDLKSNIIKKVDYGCPLEDGGFFPVSDFAAVTKDYYIFSGDLNGQLVAVAKSDFYNNTSKTILIK